MSEVITRPRASATKTPTRIIEAPTPAPKPLVSESERKVAATGAALLGQAATLIGKEDGTAYAAELLKLGNKLLKQASEGVVVLSDIQDVFFSAAGTCTGALAIEQRDHPDATHRHQLITTAFEMLNNAGLSYDCELHPCVEAAAAIEAGARQFRDPPSPPVRRDPTREGEYSKSQQHRALEFIAGAAHTLHDLLLMAQVAEESYEVSRLVDAAELMTRQIGASADTAVGAGIIGDFERWSYGPNFPREGHTA